MKKQTTKSIKIDNTHWNKLKKLARKNYRTVAGELRIAIDGHTEGK